MFTHSLYTHMLCRGQSEDELCGGVYVLCRGGGVLCKGRLTAHICVVCVCVCVYIYSLTHLTHI